MIVGDDYMRWWHELITRNNNNKWQQEMIVGDDYRRWLQKLTIGVDHQNLLINFNTKNQGIKCKILVKFFRL
jgi:hypothetical protein